MVKGLAKRCTAYAMTKMVKYVDASLFVTKSGYSPMTVKISGAAGGDRTHDPWLRRPILYPLSYSRTDKPAL
jgi:hypothetical protein